MNQHQYNGGNYTTMNYAHRNGVLTPSGKQLSRSSSQLLHSSTKPSQLTPQVTKSIISTSSTSSSLKNNEQINKKLDSLSASEHLLTKQMQQYFAAAAAAKNNATTSSEHLRHLQYFTNNKSNASIHEEETVVESEDVVTQALKLIPLEINFLLQENREAHRTADYDYPYLILRRGQPFYLSVRFDKPFDINVHTITLQFTLGNHSLISKGTHIRIPLTSRQNVQSSSWRASILNSDEESLSKNTVKIEVVTSPNAFIGRYKVYLETQFKSEKSCLFRYAEEIPIIVNPFCKDDSCYLDQESLVNEYVLNEDGMIYLGTRNKIVVRPWYFGQLQFPCLDIAFWLLDRANLPYESRGNIYHVIRAMAAMINGGDRGMIESVKYNSTNLQGFDPNEWMGSVKITKKFMEQRGQPVRYGNSWTFAAVLCTLTRSIGIPCRLVTAFNVSHDCDSCSTVDIHWDSLHRPVSQLNKDVIKVNHTWNEMWFRRNDIPPEFEGWQAVDSTSCSSSESLYRLGPCPVKALRRGNCGLLSDGHSFMSMVNGYSVHWITERNGNMIPMRLDDNCLAPKIVTKCVGNDGYEDILNNYRSNELVMMDDIALERHKRLSDMCTRKQSDDVEAHVHMMQESSHGDTVVFTWNVKNISHGIRTCEFYMNAFFASVDGKLLAECKELRGDTMTIGPNEEGHHRMKIRAEDYTDRIKPFHLLRIYSQMFVVETNQITPQVYDFEFEAYDMLKIIHDNSPVFVDRSLQIKIQITNPLKRALQNCTLHLEGLGAPRTIILERALRPLEVTVYQTNIIPNKSGRRRLYVGFSCSLLNNIYKTFKIDVLTAPTDTDDETIKEGPSISE